MEKNRHFGIRRVTRLDFLYRSIVFIKRPFGDVCKKDMLVKPPCCNKWQKKSRARNWFGE